MNKISYTLIGAFLTLLLSGATLVLAPYFQFKDTPAPTALKPYSAWEDLGRRSYVSNGCVYCHSQQPRDPSFAPDGIRGWGRPSVPADYAYDTPHLLGTMRTGPDLFNIGQRQPSEDWHHAHLYQPRSLVKGSIMPSYPYLYKIQKALRPGDVKVTLPPEYEPKEGVVVATDEAIALVAYLKALNHTYAIASKGTAAQSVAPVNATSVK
jgi:cytochrome c oxidase cbb3-type subunit II